MGLLQNLVQRERFVVDLSTAKKTRSLEGHEVERMNSIDESNYEIPWGRENAEFYPVGSISSPCTFQQMFNR